MYRFNDEQKEQVEVTAKALLFEVSFEKYQEEWLMSREDWLRIKDVQDWGFEPEILIVFADQAVAKMLAMDGKLDQILELLEQQSEDTNPTKE